jgi:hypothetical protein
MIARSLACVIALGSLCMTAAPAFAVKVAVQGDSLVGQVFSSVSRQGLPGYQVQLVAPQSAQLPVRIAITDAAGNFKFTHVWKGQSLLEVYWGLTLVSRQLIDTTKPNQYVVNLRPISRAQVARAQPAARQIPPTAMGGH